jgi:hypothetical protein
MLGRRTQSEVFRMDGEVLITSRDEGHGFNSEEVANPTTLENLLFAHGRGIYLMKRLMDEVSFDTAALLCGWERTPRAISSGSSNRGDVVRGPVARQNANGLLLPVCPLSVHKRVQGGKREPTSRYLDALTSVKGKTYGLRCSLCNRSIFRCRFQRTPFCGESKVRSIVKYLAVMCLLLTLWSAIAFAAHHHSNGTEAAKCTVCVAAHSATPNATASLLKAKFIPVSTFLPEPVFAAQSFLAFALSVRPPPAI